MWIGSRNWLEKPQICVTVVVVVGAVVALTLPFAVWSFFLIMEQIALAVTTLDSERMQELKPAYFSIFEN